MKTIQELLKLAENPYYTFTAEEQAVLDDFLAKKQATKKKTSQEKSSNESSEKTRVTVRNIVKKASTYPPEAQESAS